MSAFYKQEGGNHYTKMKIQPFQYSMANGLDPMQHTVIKYVTRFRDKGGVADLKKAIHTLELLIEHEELKKAKPTHLMGLPLPVGTNPEIVRDLHEILLDANGGRNLPQDRYDRAEELYRQHSKLVADMWSGVVPVNIIAPTYEQAQALARNMKWPVWTYFPAPSNFKGVAGRVFIVTGAVSLTTTQLSDLYIRNNTIIQLG